MLAQRLQHWWTHQNTPINEIMALLFFAAFARGISAPYTNLYLAELGLSATVIGTLLSVGAIVEMILTPTLNTLADKYNCHRTVHKLQLAIYGVICLVLATMTNIWIVGAVILFIELGRRSAFVLGMQLTLTKLEELHVDTVGKVRSSTSVGFGVANLFTGTIFFIAQYAGLFFMAGCITFFSIFFTRALPHHIADKKSQKTTSAPRRRGFYVLLITQFFIMLGLNTGFAFWLIYFRQRLGVRIEDLGILLAMTALLEVPFFVMFDKLVRRWDVRSTYIIGAIGMALTWYLVGLVPSVGWLVPLLVVRGLTFALLNMSMIVLIAKISDPRNVATNQALLQITIPGIATTLGAPFMGWIFDNFSPQTFFDMCTLMMLIGASLALLAYPYFYPRKQLAKA